MDKLVKLASEGDIESLYQLGNIYDFGVNVPRNWWKAEECFVAAATKGHAEALCYLATLHWAGYEVSKDRALAVEMWEKSAKLGIPYAIYMLHWEVKHLLCIREDADKAFIQLQQRAETGNYRDKWYLGRIYHAGLGVPMDPEKTFYWHNEAAKDGWGIAINNIALCYDNGLGVEKSREKAWEYYNISAEKDYSVAFYNLGLGYKEGRGVTENKATALEWFKKAANRGNNTAQYFVGYFYANGISVGRDWIEATKWYKKAASQQNPGILAHKYSSLTFVDATNNLGLCYEYGNGVTRNYREAFNCYVKASIEGLSVAFYNVALCYTDGRGTKQNAVKAFEYMKKAAEKGFTSAMFQLGNFFYHGNGTEENIIEAIKSWKLASQRRHGQSCYMLGKMYEDGYMIPRDVEKAMKWYNVGSQHNDFDCQNAITRLLNKSQITS